MNKPEIMMCRPAAALAVLVFPVMLAFSFPARGEGGTKDDIKLSKKHFNKGVALFKKGSYEEALEELLAAYDLHPHVKMKYNIGVCLYRMEKYAGAGNELEEFLVEEGANAKGKVVTEVFEALEAIKQEVGVVTIETETKNAEIVVDGAVHGRTPLVSGIYLEPGPHEIKAMTDDDMTWSKVINIDKGQSRTLKVELVRKPAVPDMTFEEEETEEEKPKKSKKVHNAYFYATFALALAGALGGTIAGGVAISQRNDLDGLDKECDDNPRCQHDALEWEAYGIKRDDLYNKAEMSANACTALFVIGGASAIAALALYFFSEPFKKKEKKEEGDDDEDLEGEEYSRLPVLIGGPGSLMLKIEF
ncbi:MAG: PEGA domain-containing protein [Pseudomonadota bacterium]